MNQSKPTSAMNILGPQELGTHEFDCTMEPPGDPYSVVVLRDAVWSFRGRWNLTGQIVGLPGDIERVTLSATARIRYRDGAQEAVMWRTDPGYRVGVSHDRFTAYSARPPKYPRGIDTERQAGVEVDTRTIPQLHKILAQHAPDLDQQRKTWLVAALQDWRDREVATASSRLAREAADQRDAREVLRRAVASKIDVWEPGDEDDQVRTMLDAVERVLELDEKGLPY